MKFRAGLNTNTRHLQSGLCEYLDFEHPGSEKRKFNGHLKALFIESPPSLITQTDFLKPLMNNGTRVEKIAIVKKYTAFPKQPKLFFKKWDITL